MSNRNRNSRGPGRGNGNSQGEEVHLWNSVKDEIKAALESINASNGNTREILAQDSYMTKNKDSTDSQTEEDKLSELLRAGVKVNESAKAQIESILEQLDVLRAVQKNIEEAESQALGLTGPRERPGGSLSGPGRAGSVRGAGARERELHKEREREREQRDKDRDNREREEKRERTEREREKENKEKEKEKEKEKDPASLYDFDGAGDSPVPSPMGNHTRKLGSVAGSAGTRDSVPPRGDQDTSEKGDSVPPDTMPNAASIARSKILYNKGQEVAFKPKPANPTDVTDWYLGRVIQVTGEGKSRRYKVQDADPDVPAEERTEFRTSANSMIGVPEAGADLKPRSKGEIVLALYPDSTTFYKAEVISTDAATGKVNLRFEGEENSGTLQVVERRFVLDYPKDKK
ncbi:SAGA HAT/Core module component [Coniochaeta pulveracea]|uniref:SAGA HAT/Core module component n=1 Tax=Coniochaeta pulveracea TaxID=177199 RepID=A0A420YP17_9PEZI|nr:SAGA HAT/Core module component [Coniochaeta pulveracea]